MRKIKKVRSPFDTDEMLRQASVDLCGRWG